MGLDSYARRSPEEDLTVADIQAFVSADIKLVSSPGGFRGKIYLDLVESITGISLYQEWISAAEVKEMLASLEEWKEIHAEPETPEQFDKTQDVIELIKFFRICSERNLGIVSSF